MPEPLANLNEIRAVMAQLPGPDLKAGAAAASREQDVTKPQGALGRLEELVAWLAAWQGRWPTINHPRTVVFAANHGVAARFASDDAAAVTAQMVQTCIAGGAAVNQFCKLVDADLRVYEMNLGVATADIVDAPAMTDEECACAIAYGMMAVEPGVDALAIGAMGHANTTVAAALCMGLFGADPAAWTGSANGVAGAVLEQERDVVALAVARHQAAASDPLDLLRRLGGIEFAAMVGAILAARMARVPVVLDGFCAGAAAAVLHAADPRAVAHCVAGHVSAETGHRRLLNEIGKPPLLDLGIQLGEASGATLALGVLKAAIACHIGIGSFAEAGVSGPALTA